MIEVVYDYRRISKGRAVLIVIPQIGHVFTSSVFPHFLIQRRPVFAALFAVDLMIKFIQFRMFLMNPAYDPRTVTGSFSRSYIKKD